MDKKNILELMNLGDGIAEYDDNLIEYFIDTAYVKDFINDRYDIVLGDKGAGKTAMLIGVAENAGVYPQLNNVQLVSAMNLTGDPDYKRAFTGIEEKYNNQELIDAWKIYIINVLWKQFTVLFHSEDRLKKYLEEKKLIIGEGGAFSKMRHALKRVKPEKATVYNKMKTDGSNEVGMSVDLGSCSIEEIDTETIDYNYIFEQISASLMSNDSRIWILMDRLDDAFPDRGKKSIGILKALFYCYKDLCGYRGFKIKIFIRGDIFNDITEKGFTSLTHVSSKTMPSIRWDREKIVELFIERLSYNDSIKRYLADLNINYQVKDCDMQTKILYAILKPQVDVGSNKPDTIGWILNRIKDGRGTFTPRDFILLIDRARVFQIDENRTKNNSADYLIDSPAIRKAYKAISREKLTTQLYAEYPEYRPWIEKFEKGKSTYNEKSLLKVLGAQWKSRVQKLVFVGFLEESGKVWKIPFIYRPALEIVQGKAE